MGRTSITIRFPAEAGCPSSTGTEAGRAVGAGATGTTICEDLSTSPLEERVVFSMTTGEGGVTVGGMSAGVATVSTRAGAGGAGSGSSIRSATLARVGRPNRPAK